MGVADRISNSQTEKLSETRAVNTECGEFRSIDDVTVFGHQSSLLCEKRFLTRRSFLRQNEIVGRRRVYLY